HRKSLLLPGAWPGAGLVTWNPSKVMTKLPRSYILDTTHLDNQPSILNISQRTDKVVEAILTGITSPSMKSHVLLLQKEALDAVADKHIYQYMNQEIVKKKQPKKRSH